MWFRKRIMPTLLIDALRDPAAYPHGVASIEVIETHISWVVLAGDFAYKIKKPVVLPFADFGSLAKRRHCCEEEVRLNRRFAPQIYIGVVPITGSAESPCVEGRGAAFEYAVKMHRFDQDALLDHLLARNELHPEVIDRLADRIAAFHTDAPATSSPEFGTPDKVLRSALDNFAEMTTHADKSRRLTLAKLEKWTKKTFDEIEPVVASRHRGGKVRECHGDLHLRNITLIGREPVPFDCIEFSAALRWIDVIDEVAFLVMDLLDRGRPDLGYRFLDRYLAGTGDYAAIAVLRFYLVYRALVRAKVHDLRGRQAGGDPQEARRLQGAASHYLALADGIARSAKPTLILMHGFSGAGKSRVAAALVESLGAIRVRADVERKRLFGLDGSAHGGAAINAGIYTREATKRTYARMAGLAEAILMAGYTAVLDATFLHRWQRGLMFDLARRLHYPLWIVDCTANAATLRKRVSARASRGDDPSEATLEVLVHQMAVAEPLTAEEQPHAVCCSMQASEAAAVGGCVATVLRRLGIGAGSFF